MTYFSIWPFFIIIAFLLCIISLPIFRWIKVSDFHQNRVQTIDGLRGFLAYGVIFSHGQNFHTLFAKGEWISGSPNPFYNTCGAVAIRLFLMITAYLFWSKLLASQGKVEWLSFYIKRFFRIAPVYWFAFLCVFMIVMIESHWTIKVSWLALSEQVGSWLALGILPLPDINNRMVTMMILLGVVWTLQYEWFFYGVLPFIAWFARNRSRSLIFVCTVLILFPIISLFMHDYPTIKQVLTIFFMFFCGMLCASLQQYIKRIPLNSFVQSMIVVIVMIYIFSVYSSDRGYTATALVTIVFFFIVYNCSVFGVLKLKASQRMGEISYSLYLLQGIVFHWVYASDFIRSYILRGAIEFWSIMTLICTLILLFAICVHYALEKPGIKMGYKCSSLLNSKRK